MYQFRDKKQIVRRRKARKLILLVFFLSLVTFFIIYMTSFGMWQYLGKPFWNSKNFVNNKVDDSGYLLRTKESVYKKNRELVLENINLKNQMLDYQILKKENDDLKDLMGRKKPEYNFVLANILTKPNFSPYDTITIDVGSDAGLVAGDRVYANAITPIGEVDTVYKDTSVVVLYSNPGEVTIGMIEGTNTSIEIVGRGGGNFEMTTPVDLYVEKGKNILLPNISSEIVAVVGDIISMPNDPMKKFILNSPVNIQDLKWVEVKKN